MSAHSDSIRPMPLVPVVGRPSRPPAADAGGNARDRVEVAAHLAPPSRGHADREPTVVLSEDAAADAIHINPSVAMDTIPPARSAAHRDARLVLGLVVLSVALLSLVLVRLVWSRATPTHGVPEAIAQPELPPAAAEPSPAIPLEALPAAHTLPEASPAAQTPPAARPSQPSRH